MADTHSYPVQESFLDEGFILDKKIGVGQPKRIENAKILVANTAMDTDKIKIYGARVRVDSMQKVRFCTDPRATEWQGTPLLFSGVFADLRCMREREREKLACKAFTQGRVVAQVVPLA